MPKSRKSQKKTIWFDFNWFDENIFTQFSITIGKAFIRYKIGCSKSFFQKRHWPNSIFSNLSNIASFPKSPLYEIISLQQKKSSVAVKQTRMSNNGRRLVAQRTTLRMNTKFSSQGITFYR